MYRIFVATPGFSTRHRNIVAGIAQYAAGRADWDLFYDFHVSNAPHEVAMLARDLNINGAIIHNYQVVVDPAFRALGIPFVSTVLHSEGLCPTVTVDNAEIGRMAAEHLLSLGLRHFLYIGDGALPFRQRVDAFIEAIGDRGQIAPSIDLEGIKNEWQLRQGLGDVIETLRAMPKPFGLFVHKDSRASRIINAAQAAGLLIPDEMAVISVDNDQLACELARVPLSSIDGNGREIGHRAGQLLTGLFEGMRPPTTPIYVQPGELHARKSTGMQYIDDPEIRRAMECIRRNVGRRFTVADLLELVPLSRRTLERGFEKALGRSPYEEIMRLKAQLAARLLCDSEQSIRSVIRAAGFAGRHDLTRAMRKHLSTTPGAYRRLHCDQGKPPSQRPVAG